MNLYHIADATFIRGYHDTRGTHYAGWVPILGWMHLLWKNGKPAAIVSLDHLPAPCWEQLEEVRN